MEIHEVVDNSTLKVVLDLVDDDLLAHIDQLHVRQVLLVLIDRLVNLLVIAYSVPKIQRSRLRILALIVWRGSFDLDDVCHDGLFRITLGLHIERLDVVGVATLTHPPSSSLCRVCSIQYSHRSTVFLEPFEHVLHGGFRSSMPHTLAVFIGCIEEVGCGLWGVLSAVGADIEGLGVYRKPSQVSDDCFKSLLSASACAKSRDRRATYLSGLLGSCLWRADQP